MRRDHHHVWRLIVFRKPVHVVRHAIHCVNARAFAAHSDLVDDGWVHFGAEDGCRCAQPKKVVSLQAGGQLVAWRPERSQPQCGCILLSTCMSVRKRR